MTSSHSIRSYFLSWTPYSPYQAVSPLIARRDMKLSQLENMLKVAIKPFMATDGMYFLSTTR